jgi:DNA polymerase-3 subunit beta
MATDLEMWIEHTLPTPTMGADGAASVPARNFTELVAAMPDSDVEFHLEDETHALRLRCNRANYKLLGLPADEFPLLPQVKEESRFVVDRAVLREAIRQTVFAASTDETRPMLTGVLVVFQGDTLKLVATDTHRLAVRECAVKQAQGSASAIVPSRVMNELLRIGSDEGDVVVTLSASQIQFEVPGDTPHADASSRKERLGDTTLISRLIDGQYPNYERVIPTQSTRRLTLERDPFVAGIRRAAVVARDSANRVVLRTTEDGERLTITAESGSVGNAYEEIEVAGGSDIEPVEIAFNAKYLIDVLSVIDSEGLHIDLTEPLRPGIVRPTGDSNYLCVLMPMQVV